MAASLKARIFNGSSDFLASASTINLSAITSISIAFWWYHNAFVNDDSTSTLDFGSSSDGGSFYFDFDYTNGEIQFFFKNGGNSTWTFPRPSAAAWHHYALRWNITGLPVVAIDGSLVTVTPISTAHTVDAFGNKTLYVGCFGGSGSFVAGRISDLALWPDYQFLLADAISLAGCGDPGSISPAPTYWWPIKHLSPETPDAGGINLTVTGTTTGPSSCAGAEPPTTTLMGQILT